MLAVLVACLGCGAAMAQTVVLSMPGAPGGLRISNPAVTAVEIEGAVAVEAWFDGAWRARRTEFHARALCGPDDGPRVVRIAPGQVLDVVPWRGFSCSGQCVMGCRANIYFGAGPFRFVVAMVPSRQRVAGPEFRMPGRPG